MRVRHDSGHFLYLEGAGSILFDDPAVEHAAEVLGQVMFTDGYVLGGADQTPSIAFGDAPTPMFNDPPSCWLHRQANFINAFFPDDAVAGVDYDWFPFPPIDHGGTLFAGELSAVFRDAPEVRDFIERGVLTLPGDRLALTQAGLVISDGLWPAFLQSR